MFADCCDPAISTTTLPGNLQTTFAEHHDGEYPSHAEEPEFEYDDDDSDGETYTERNRRWSLPDDVYARMENDLSQTRSSKLVSSLHLHMLHHMLWHAESIYGLPLVLASAPAVSLTRLKDKAIVCKLTGISSHDMLLSEFRTKPFHPAFYVAIDCRVDAIVICIRGTANIVDTLTDVAATQDVFLARRFPTPTTSPSTSFSNLPDLGTSGVGVDGAAYIRGFGHAGILRSARNLYAKVRQSVIDAVRKHPDFTVVITGHSLGGATAAVLALLLRDDVDCPNAVSVAFGPPPCVSYDLAEQTSALGISVVNGPDVVPRLSVAVLLPLFATARYVADLPRTRKTLLAVGLRKGVLNWEQLEKVTVRRTVHMEKLHDGRRVFLAGGVVHLISREDNEKGLETYSSLKLKPWRRKRPVDAVHVSRAKFLFVKRRQRGMFASHAMVSYRVALADALRSVGEQPLRLDQFEEVRERAGTAGGFPVVWSAMCHQPPMT